MRRSRGGNTVDRPLRSLYNEFYYLIIMPKCAPVGFFAPRRLIRSSHMILKSFDEWALARLRAIPKNAAAAAVTAFVLGFVMHLASMTELLCNWDSLISLSTDSAFLVAQGKWFFPVLHNLRGTVGCGSLSGPLALAYIAIASGFIVVILGVKRPVFAALCGAVMAAFPSVMCAFSYAGEDIFCLAMLMAVLAVYVTVRYDRFGWLGGLLLLTLATGTYQSYIDFAGGLFVLCCLFELLYSGKKTGEILKRGLKYIAVLLASAALYYLVLKVVLAVGGTELSDYRGVSGMGSFDLANIPNLIHMTYNNLLWLMLRNRNGGDFPALRVLYILVSVLTCVYFFANVVRSRFYRDVRRSLLTLAVLAAYPVAVSAVIILSQNRDIHWIMNYPIVLTFLVPLRFADGARLFVPVDGAKGAKIAKPGERDRFLLTAAEWAVAAVMLVTLFNWGIVANSGYARLQTAYEGAYANSVRMVADIDAVRSTVAPAAAAVSGSDAAVDGAAVSASDTELARRELPVAFVSLGKPQLAVEDDLFAFLDGYTGITTRRFIYLPSHYEYMMTHYVGAGFDYCTEEERERLEADPALADMGVYPASGSVREHDGYLVVRID